MISAVQCFGVAAAQLGVEKAAQEQKFVSLYENEKRGLSTCDVRTQRLRTRLGLRQLVECALEQVVYDAIIHH
jgi:hypothetical protein